MDLPIWESLKNLRSYLDSLSLGEIECPIPPNITLVNAERISIGKGSVIEPGAYIEGPCVIGRDCQIRHGAYLRGYVLTGDRCVIGHSTEAKHAIFLNDSKAPHFNYVGDSILGNYVSIGAGVICANFRLDKEEVIVDVEGEIYQTGITKFGAVLGDSSQLGCNTVINPGVLLRKRTYSRACTSIQKSNLRKINNAKTADQT
ncbi:MAG: UDP-N-acetylglucosamine diphosphorylase [Candidatus Neptunochlamydia sp.]|nr:UDP-N-acetylglucosamine diphosphorylase [Candidatus Neptunochlamydia sp.]